jgi:hypothetical protein
MAMLKVLDFRRLTGGLIVSAVASKRSWPIAFNLRLALGLTKPESEDQGVLPVRMWPKSPA